MRTTVLILDTDLGFVFWLGRTLDAAGYQSLPAKSIADAATLLEELSLRVDLLIVNPSLRGAAEFISRLRRFPWPLKVIGLMDEEGAVPIVSGIDLWHRKLFDNVNIAGMRWLQLVQNILADNSAKN